MACDLNAYKTVMDEMRSKKKDDGSYMTDAEIIDILSADPRFEEIAKTGIENGIDASYIEPLLTSENTEVKTMASTALLEKGQEEVTTNYLSGLSTEAKDALYKTSGFKEWTKLPGEFDFDKAVDDGKYFLTYLQAGDKNALAVVDEVKKSNDPVTVNALIVLLSYGGNAVDAKQWLKTDTVLYEMYTAAWSDYRNVPEDMITIDPTYGTMKWVNSFGESSDKTEFKPFDGRNLAWMIGEDGKWGYNELIKGEYSTTANYKSGTWKINKEKYAEMLISGELEGKTFNEQKEYLNKVGLLKDDKINITNTEWWTCSGTLCGSSSSSGSGSSGGGGGGGGSSGGSSRSSGTTTSKETQTSLFIECNVDDAEVWNKKTNVKLGRVNETITLPVGEYTIQVKAAGYTTRETVVTIDKYAVSRTINLTKAKASISTFINGIGGIQNLTKTKYLYLFCIHKMRKTSMYGWKEFADTIDNVSLDVIPTGLTEKDVLYVYYLVNGDPSTAGAMVDAGDVVLLDAEGGETTQIENAQSGSVGGGL